MDDLEIIGLAGYARSGKNTVGDLLAKYGGYTQRGFADPIRSALYTLNPSIRVQGGYCTLRELVDGVGWEQAKDLSPDVRELQQRFGTEIGRAWNPDFWLVLAFRGLPSGKYVFTDVRFKNEADTILAIGGRVYRVHRDGVGPANGHNSESGLDAFERWTGHIYNNGTLGELEEQVISLLTPATGVQ